MGRTDNNTAFELVSSYLTTLQPYEFFIIGAVIVMLIFIRITIKIGKKILTIGFSLVIITVILLWLTDTI